MITLTGMAKSQLIGRFLSVFLLMLSYQGLAQDGGITHIKVRLTGDAPRLSKFYDRHVFDAGRFNEVKQSLFEDAYSRGYLALRLKIDTIGDTVFLDANLGNVYSWAGVNAGTEVSAVMRRAGVNIERFQKRPVSPHRISGMMEKGVKWLENNGFPFAELKLDSFEFHGKTLECALTLNKGPLVKIDSVIVKGSLQVRKAYLTNYLGIKEGQLYEEKAIRELSSKLADVPFVQEFKPAEVRFNKAQTKVSLYLNTKKASRFDGIVGFLPDEETGRILFTGDVALHLENPLKQGEVIDLNWRKLQTNTQDLALEVIAPFVFNSSLSPDANLKIYRRDTLFTDIFTQLGIRYVFTRNNYLRAFVDRQTTNLNSTTEYENTLVIPPYLDRSIVSYGLGLNMMKLDYRLNPARGVEVYLEGAAGNKTIIENPNLPEFIYDSLALKTLQIKSRANIAYYVPLVPRLIWHQRYMSATLVNDQLFNNEAYRIGGLKTLRGFNEESIFATTYVLIRNELRYQVERNGYVFLLFDGAWYENQSLNRVGAGRDTPYAFGGGITFGTRAGIFSLSYALGSQQNNPILVRAAKIHFGFLSVF